MAGCLPETVVAASCVLLPSRSSPLLMKYRVPPTESPTATNMATTIRMMSFSRPLPAGAASGPVGGTAAGACFLAMPNIRHQQRFVVGFASSEQQLCQRPFTGTATAPAKCGSDKVSGNRRRQPLRQARDSDKHDGGDRPAPASRLRRRRKILAEGALGVVIHQATIARGPVAGDLADTDLQFFFGLCRSSAARRTTLATAPASRGPGTDRRR